MSFLKKKLGLTIIIVVLAAFLSAVITHITGNSPITMMVRTILSPFNSGVSYIADSVNNQINFIWEADSYKKQNEALTNQILELRKKNKETSVYQEEIEQLNALLDLQNSNSGYSTVAASVIGYSSTNRYDKLEINKGSASGINIGNAVITENGIVGTVTETGANWSMITTVIAPKSATGIIVSRTNDIGVIEGDNDLCGNSLCKLTFVDKGASIIVGDLLETSGTGEIYPAGLNVGTIREISADNMGMLNYATVEPSVDFGKLRKVLIITGVQG